MNNVKKQVFTAIGLSIIGMSAFAETFMQVKTKDGGVTRFDVNNVELVDFETGEVPYCHLSSQERCYGNPIRAVRTNKR